MKANMPQGGRIGRFAKFVKNEVEPDALENVLQDADRYKSFKPDKQAAWWRCAVERLEDEVGEHNAIKVMQACGRKCCGQGHRKTAKRLMDESASIQEFLHKASSHGVKEGEIE